MQITCSAIKSSPLSDKVFHFLTVEANRLFPQIAGQNKQNLAENFICANINLNLKHKVSQT